MNKYGQYLIEENGRLLCQLTSRYVNKDAAQIERHVQGRRFQRALHRQQNGEALETNNNAGLSMIDDAITSSSDNSADNDSVDDGLSEDHNASPYPELEEDSASDAASDPEMNAMDTDADLGVALKRPARKRKQEEAPEVKRKRAS